MDDQDYFDLQDQIDEMNEKAKGLGGLSNLYKLSQPVEQAPAPSPVTPSPIVQAPKPSPIDYSKYALTQEDYDRADKQKALNTLGASIANIGAAPTYASLSLGIKPGEGVSAEKQNAEVDAALGRKKALLDNYRAIVQAKKQDRESALAEASADPESDISKRTVAAAKQYMTAIAGRAKMPELADIVKEGMTANEANEVIKDALKSGVKGAFDVLARETTNNRLANSNELRNELASKRLELMNDRLGIQKDEQSRRAVNDIVKDSRISKMSDSIDMTNRALNIIDRPGITNQEFNDVQIELSNAIAGARSSALGKLERTEYHTFEQTIAEIKQRATGEFANESVPPAFVARVRKLATNLVNDLYDQRIKRANLIKKDYKNNSNANEAANNAISLLRNDSVETSQSGKAPNKYVGKVYSLGDYLKSQGKQNASDDEKIKIKKLLQSNGINLQ